MSKNNYYDDGLVTDYPSSKSSPKVKKSSRTAKVKPKKININTQIKKYSIVSFIIGIIILIGMILLCINETNYEKNLADKTAGTMGGIAYVLIALFLLPFWIAGLIANIVLLAKANQYLAKQKKKSPYAILLYIGFALSLSPLLLFRIALSLGK